MVQENILEEIDSDRLAVHVVWMPVLGTDDREAALSARSLIHDPRARHYWSDDQDLGFAFARTVDLPRGKKLAWDIYFAFAPGVVWDEDVPAPTDWAHQLGLDDRHLMDGQALRRSVKSLLAPESKPTASATLPSDFAGRESGDIIQVSCGRQPRTRPETRERNRHRRDPL